MSSRGILLVLSGPSGSGKSTVCRELVRQQPSIFYSVSVTTRLPREEERNGVSYYFIPKEKFMEMVRANEFLEWAQVYDDFYGTPRNPVEEALARGEDVILEIDVQGGLQVKQSLPEAVLIFLLPPTRDDLRLRLTRRSSEPKVEIEKRLQWSNSELQALSSYEYLVINDRVENAVRKIQCILAAEKCRLLRLNLKDWLV